MAVTIHQQPDVYTPSGNPVIWTFSSDQTAQANFSYLVEVYVDGTLQGRQQIFPESGIYGRVDCSSYAETYTNAPVMTNDLTSDAGNNVQIYIKVIERYGDPIADGADATSSTVDVFKAGMSNVDFINWDASLYAFDGGAIDNKWFTTFPSGERDYCADGEQKRLMVISDDVVAEMNISLYDENGSNFFDDATATVTAKILVLNVGIADFVNAGIITQADADNTVYYELLVTDGAAASSELYTIYVDRRCQRDTAKRVHFLSTWGTLESYTYSLYSNISGAVTSNRYEREFGTFNGSAFDFNLSDGTTLDYRKRLTRKMLLRSNWLKEDVQHWLEEMVSLSPYTFIEDADDANVGLRRVAVEKNQFTFKTFKQNKLFREDLSIILDSHNSTTL